MLVEFEILIMMEIAIIFSVIAILIQEQRARLTFGLISAITWFIFGLVFVAASPTFPMFALLFFVLGIIFVVETIVISTDMLGGRKTRR